MATAVSLSRFFTYSDDVETLFQISKRIDEFIAASQVVGQDSASPGLLAVYRDNASAVRLELLGLADEHPDAAKAAERVEQIVALVTSNALQGASRAVSPVAERMLGRQLTSQSVALNSALDDVLFERRRAIAAHSSQAIVLLGLSGLSFGILCLFGFYLFDRRIARPIAGFVNTLKLIRSEDPDLRFRPTGHDEVAQLARQFNATLDERALALQELEQARYRLVEAQAIANVGGWDWLPGSESLACSQQVAAIFGLDLDDVEKAQPGFIDYLHADDQAKLEEALSRVTDRHESMDMVHRVVRSDGEIRWVRQRITAAPLDGQSAGRLVGTIQDVTDEYTLSVRAAALDAQMASMLEAITDGFVAMDEHWRYTYVNAEASRMLGKTSDELLGTTVWSHFDMAGSESERALRRTMDQRVDDTAEEFFAPLNAWFETRIYPWGAGLAVFFRDVSEEHRLVDTLRSQQQELAQYSERLANTLETREALINSLPANIAVLDEQGNVVDVNSYWRDYGRTHEAKQEDYGLGHNYVELCRAVTGEEAEDAHQVADGIESVLRAEADRFSHEYPCHAPDSQHWFRLMVRGLKSGDGDMRGAVAMHVDITERKLAEQALEQLAFEDPLTGTLSRMGILQSLDAKLEHDGWQNDAAVVMVDVVAQHDINEAYGYEVGDALLIELAGRFKKIVSGDGLVARTGGDEFAFYLVANAERSIEDSLGMLCRQLAQPLQTVESGSELEIDLHIGFTLLGEQRREARALLQEAELALFEHRSGSVSKDRWVEYTAQLKEKTLQRIALTNEMVRALQQDEFELHYQPKVALSSGRVISAEALIRWRHPQRGLLSPGLFIPVAEQSQLIGPIGDWVLREACRQQQLWRAEGLDLVRVSVNVSQIQFVLGTFSEKVKAALAEFDVDPAALSLEITESVFENQSDRLLTEIRRLHDLGVRLSLDDFGTGYSSLLYIQQYPFDEIKIDQGFVMQLMEDDYSNDIVDTVIRVAHALKAEVVAEGIESAEVAARLRTMGCEVGQGYYYSMPLETEDFAWLLRQHSTLPLQ
jgi:diguanylate cyclase (GGDEF)-like protein/PAS domain S-box-containing protein